MKCSDDGALRKLEHLTPLSIVDGEQIGDDPVIICALDIFYLVWVLLNVVARSDLWGACFCHRSPVYFYFFVPF